MILPLIAKNVNSPFFKCVIRASLTAIEVSQGSHPITQARQVRTVTRKYLTHKIEYNTPKVTIKVVICLKYTIQTSCFEDSTSKKPSDKILCRSVIILRRSVLDFSAEWVLFIPCILIFRTSNQGSHEFRGRKSFSYTFPLRSREW